MSESTIVQYPATIYSNSLPHGDEQLIDGGGTHVDETRLTGEVEGELAVVGEHVPDGDVVLDRGCRHVTTRAGPSVNDKI